MTKAPKLAGNARDSQTADMATGSDRNGPHRLACARCCKKHLKCSLAKTQAPDRQLGGTEGLHPDDGRCAQCVAANENDCSPRSRKKQEPRSALKARIAASTDVLDISVDHLESLLAIFDGRQPYDPAKLLSARFFIAEVKNAKAAAQQSVHPGPDSVVSLNTATVTITDVAQTTDNASGTPVTTASGTYAPPTLTGAIALDSTLTSTRTSTDLHLQYPPPSGIPMYQGNSDSVNPLMLKGNTTPASVSRAANIYTAGAARPPYMRELVPSFMGNATVPGGGGNDATTSSNQAMAITPQYPADLGNIFANATTNVQPPAAPGGPSDLDEWSQYNLLLSLSGNGDGTSAGNDGTAAASSSAANRLPVIEEGAYIPYMTDLDDFFASITNGNAPPPESHAVTHEDFNYFAQDYSTSACQSGSSMQQPPCE